jgi:hypothetical protein
MNPFLHASASETPWHLHGVLDIASDPDPVEVAGDGEERRFPGNPVREDLFRQGNLSWQMRLNAGFASPVMPDVGLREVLHVVQRKYRKVALSFRPLIA